MFSKHVGVKNSNEREILAILEALFAFIVDSSGLVSLIVESDSTNAVSWPRTLRGPWNMQFYFNKMSDLSTGCCISFQHISRSANEMVDTLAKQGADCL